MYHTVNPQPRDCQRNGSGSHLHASGGVKRFIPVYESIICRIQISAKRIIGQRTQHCIPLPSPWPPVVRNRQRLERLLPAALSLVTNTSPVVLELALTDIDETMKR